MFVSHFENKIRQASELKGEGNKEFKEKKYYEARDVYQKAVGLIEPYALHGANETELMKAAELRANLNFNIGLCSFNMMQWREAEIKFTAAIDINPGYAKALCKRAVTRYQLEEYKTALIDIKSALQIDPSNQEFYEILNKIVAKYEENQRKEFEVKQTNSKSTKSSKNQPKPQKPKEEPKSASVSAADSQQTKASDPKNKKGSKWWIVGGITAVIGIGLLINHKHNRK